MSDRSATVLSCVIAASVITGLVCITLAAFGAPDPAWLVITVVGACSAAGVWIGRKVAAL